MYGLKSMEQLRDEVEFNGTLIEDRFLPVKEVSVPSPGEVVVNKRHDSC